MDMGPGYTVTGTTGKSPGIYQMLAFGLGLTCFIAQLVILREFLNLFMGNELIIGIVLSLWMLMTAAGALAGRYLRNTLKQGVFFYLLLLLMGLLPLGGALLGLWLRVHFFTPGVMISLQGVLGISLAGLSAFCIFSGMFFTLLAAAASEKTGRGGIARIYAVEAAGSLAGGILFNFLLVYLFNSFRILSILLVMNMMMAVIYAYLDHRRLLAGITLLLLLPVIFLSATVNPDILSARMLYPGQDILTYKDTPLGKLAVTEREGQVNLYQGGQPMAIVNDVPEREEKVHYAMSLHPDPKKVLMLAGGLDGSLDEINKYGIDRLHYIEPDPWLARTAMDRGWISWPEGMHMICGDPGRFLDTASQAYDVVILNAPPPLTIGSNRFYTDGFFEKVKENLRKGGIFSLRLPASGNYLDEKSRMLYSTIMNTLERHFSYTRLVPGYHNYFISSDSPVDDKITVRIEEDSIQTIYVNRWYLDDARMDRRASAILAELDPDARINTDFRPLASYLGILRWLGMFRVPAWIVAMIPILIMLFLLLRLSPVNTGLFAAGFTASSAEFLLMIAFQFMYGIIYQVAGIIIMAFMAGLAAGSGYLYRYAGEGRRSFIRMQIAIAIFIGILPLLLFLMEKNTGTWLPAISICLLTFISAVMTGILYRLATGLSRESYEKVAASTYGADLAGSAFGLFLIAVFIFPLIGIFWSGLMLAGMNIMAAAIMRFRYLK